MDLCCYPCQQHIRHFEIEAIELPIVYNKYGDHDPNGLLYVLKEDAKRIQEKAWENFNQEIPQPYEEVQPLVIRANLGDRIEIDFTHSLGRSLSIHVQGLDYEVQTSDGASVGFNQDSTTKHAAHYTWYAVQEGVYLFQDMGDVRGGEEGTNAHGLFGAVIVEAPESRWLNPENGEELKSGLFADIYHSTKPAFREYAVFFHDELEMKNADGEQPTDPHTGPPSSTTAISYRSEPMRNRLPLTEEHSDSGEDISMSSWVYGDPAPPILRAYVGDPAKIRLVHGGVKETHVFHLHNHQWRKNDDCQNSTIIDSISISPQETFTLDILHGAGSLNGTIGDVIFHCHLYPHFHEGMWTLWRIHDRLEDGTGTLPDGTRIPALEPLRDRLHPLRKDEEHPGYPNFINGEFGERPLQPPLGILSLDGTNKIEPTELEEANFVENFVPGALYTDTCPCHTDCRDMSVHMQSDGENCGNQDGDSCENVKLFEIALVQAKLTYNRYGWHDPQGRFFVLKEELERHGGLERYIRKVESGRLQPEPLVIRVNAGDCVEIRLTNLLPEFLEGSPFQRKTLTDIVGYHIHLVKFDTIVSDGAANGWNNIAGARKYETLVERFFADNELHTVFFHDHLFANVHQMHGVFGALLVEEAGATFHDIRTGAEICSGTKAVIKRRDGSSFREFALFVHDFAMLFDRKGRPLNPPKVPGSHDDPGVMGINYRSEPLRERLRCLGDNDCDVADEVDGVAGSHREHRAQDDRSSHGGRRQHYEHDDPAYVFSSLVHGDPATPILETYPDDEMVIRLLDGAHEEQHVFNLTGMSWKQEIDNIASRQVASQTIGISEAFNIRINQPYEAGDYLYYFGGIDDIWLGLWGIIRAYDKPRKHLKPLCKATSQIQPLPPCPGAYDVIRRYEIAAIQADIPYNKYGDHDPDGLLFVPLEDAEDILTGKRKPKPLILRANAGDWIEVTLHNLFDRERPIEYYDYPSVPLDCHYEPSMRVSLNPQFLQYHPVNDSGINVGYNNREQTVAPGESKKYLWHATEEFGACILQSFGDVRNHRYHGLFGAAIIEPVGANWYQKDSVASAPYAEEAVITPLGEERFRECVVFIQNGIRMLDKDGTVVKTIIPDEGEGIDHEDTGEKGCNYRSERFANRLKKDSRISKIFSSRVHGDPSTPLFRMHSGERMIFRTVMPADKPRNVGFNIHGHRWKEKGENSCVPKIPVQGAISIGNTYNMELAEGKHQTGDYLYRSGSLMWDVESGMWGILRVTKRSLACRCTELCRRVKEGWKH